MNLPGKLKIFIAFNIRKNHPKPEQLGGKIMKLILTSILVVMVLTSCTGLVTPVATDTIPTDNPQTGIPNPASVNCTENGNTLEIRTADDGSQFGMCISPDGSTCEEWAYFRGECTLTTQDSPTPEPVVEPTAADISDASGGFMEPGTAEEITDWWGVIKKTDTGAQYDDYFERQDMGQVIYFGIDSMDDSVKTQIMALRDSGMIVHLYGTLLSNVPDYNGSQIQVDRIEVEE